MMPAESFPSYRAPQNDRQILCRPPWSTVASDAAGWRDTISTDHTAIAGVSRAELSRIARSELVLQASKFTGAYSDPIDPVSSDRPLIITGHQPGFVHPGVWLKNFAAGQLADHAMGTAVHLIIDNDLCRAASIRVPTGTVQQPLVAEVPFDQPQRAIPWEERAMVDPSLWNSFGKRVGQTLEPLLTEPLITPWWSDVMGCSEGSPQLGLAIARARHGLEHRWGNRSLEIPQSQVCQTTSFQHFALHLFSNATKFRRDHNDALSIYRQAHRLRNAAQPLPDLEEIEGWIETPFWLWSAAEPTRRPLYVQSQATGLQLSDRQRWEAHLPLATADACQSLTEWENQGIRIRSRALTTTLYARLLLADMFIHGIGGAKYDQVTDLLCERFFGIQLPSFLTMSGTLRLPIDHQSIPPTAASDLRQSLRKLRYHPETLISQLDLDETMQAQADGLVEQKQRWVRTSKTAGNAAQRHAEIEAANSGLQALLHSRREALQRQLRVTITQTRANQILESRECPFCLFPRELLQNFLLDFSQRIP